MNQTPISERLHIGIFGKCNAGKSSVMNALTGQSLAIVSEIKGTTTDPVAKSMELPPLGPVVLIDTPGLDDFGDLGDLRAEKAYQVLRKVDIAILVVDGSVGITKEDDEILEQIQRKNIPHLVAINKMDLVDENSWCDVERSVCISATTRYHIKELLEQLAKAVSSQKKAKRLMGDLIQPMDVVVLVVPIDDAAPKGRLILPQQQAIRDILEAGGVSLVVKDTELEELFAKLRVTPNLVITDSQVFGKVAGIVPKTIPLTSFSILMARYKGDLKEVLKGAYALEKLQAGDVVLISEGCTHHRQCEDIGTVKLPKWIREYTGKEIEFEFTSGMQFPEDLSKYKMIVHCGGCMLNEREMKSRIKCAQEQGVPITNYGTAIAHMKGILKRSLEIFGDKI